MTAIDPRARPVILPLDLRESAETATRADLERRLRADESMSALLDVLDEATDDRRARLRVALSAAAPLSRISLGGQFLH